MANNYMKSVVEPTIPQGFLDSNELLTLAALGFSFEEWRNGELHFFDDGSWSSDDIHINVYGLNMDSFLAEQLVDYLYSGGEYKYQNGVITVSLEEWNQDADGDDGRVCAENIFRDIMTREGFPDNILFITIKGIFYCDKMRPGEFGGYCSVISRRSVLHGSTDSLANRMKESVLSGEDLEWM